MKNIDFRMGDPMFQKQKEVILDLLKSDMTNKNYENSYLFPYKDFLDITDDFTEFSCERLDGKQNYITLIDGLFSVDKTAEVYVKVYSFEEDSEDIWIYADDFIVISKLSLYDIKQIFNSIYDIFPSEIGIFDFNDEKCFVIGEQGHLIPAISISKSGYFIYDCWWD